MLAPWLELPTVAERIDAYSQAAVLDLRTHGTTSDGDTIRDTAIAQPLLVASALATGRELLGPDVPSVVAGHSVGEFAAAALAGAIDDHDALRLVAVRSTAMARAAAASEPSSMAAVLGGDTAEVLALLESLGLTPANMNGGGQIVAAGAKDAITRLVEAPPERARVIELQVAGAFHTAYMRPAVEALALATTTVTPRLPRATLLSNADGRAVSDGTDALTRMVNQVASPVRWDRCQEAMLELGVTALIELAPGGVLAGLAKRTMKGIDILALKTPADLESARELMELHA